MEQRIITPGENYKGLDDWIKETGSKKILMVCDGSIWYQKEFNVHLEEIEKTEVQMIGFRDFQPNPLYENVQVGVKSFSLPQPLSAIVPFSLRVVLRLPYKRVKT